MLCWVTQQRRCTVRCFSSCCDSASNVNDTVYSGKTFAHKTLALPFPFYFWTFFFWISGSAMHSWVITGTAAPGAYFPGEKPWSSGNYFFFSIKKLKAGGSLSCTQQWEEGPGPARPYREELARPPRGHRGSLGEGPGASGPARARGCSGAAQVRGGGAPGRGWGLEGGGFWGPGRIWERSQDSPGRPAAPARGGGSSGRGSLGNVGLCARGARHALECLAQLFSLSSSDVSDRGRCASKLAFPGKINRS